MQEFLAKKTKLLSNRDVSKIIQ